MCWELEDFVNENEKKWRREEQEKADAKQLAKDVLFVDKLCKDPNYDLEKALDFVGLSREDYNRFKAQA